MPSREADGKAKVTKHLPNKRERAAAQYGQFDSETIGDWDAGAGEPSSLKDALDRIAAVLEEMEVAGAPGARKP